MLLWDRPAVCDHLEGRYRRQPRRGYDSFLLVRAPGLGAPSTAYFMVSWNPRKRKLCRLYPLPFRSVSRASCTSVRTSVVMHARDDTAADPSAGVDSQPAVSPGSGIEEEAVVRGHGQSWREDREAKPYRSLSLDSTEQLNANKGFRNRPCCRPRETRRRAQRSAAQLVVGVAALVCALFMYTQCHKTLASIGPHSRERAPRLPHSKAGSAERRLARGWANEKDLCSARLPTGQVDQPAPGAERKTVSSGTGRDGEPADDSDSDLEAAVETELQRLRSQLAAEEEQLLPREADRHARGAEGRRAFSGTGRDGEPAHEGETDWEEALNAELERLKSHLAEEEQSPSTAVGQRTSEAEKKMNSGTERDGGRPDDGDGDLEAAVGAELERLRSHLSAEEGQPPSREADRRAHGAEGRRVFPGTEREGEPADEGEGDLEAAVNGELERLRSHLSAQVGHRSEAPARFSSYPYTAKERSQSQFERAMRSSLEYGVDLSQLLEEAEAVARRAAELQSGGPSLHASKYKGVEKDALAVRAKNLVIRMHFAAEKLGETQRKCRQFSARLDIADLPLVAEATYSWPLPRPSDPFTASALVNASMLSFRTRRTLDWTERVLHQEPEPAPTVTRLGRSFSREEVRALADLLRRALPGVERRAAAWRAVARSHGLKVIELSPDGDLPAKARSLVDQMCAKLQSVGLPGRFDDIVRGGKLDLESLQLCGEVVLRRKADATRILSEARRTGTSAEVRRAEEECQAAYRLSDSVRDQLRDAKKQHPGEGETDSHA